MESPTSALSDVIAVLRRAGLLLRARPGLVLRGTIAGATMPFALVLIGIPLLGTWLVTSYRIALERDEDRAGAGWGLLALAGIAHAATQLMMFFATALGTTACEPRITLPGLLVSVLALAPIHAGVCGSASLAGAVVTAATVRAGLAEGLARVLAVLRARPLSLFSVLGTPIALQTALCVAIGMVLADHPVLAQGIAAIVVGISHIALAAATEIELLRPRASDRFGVPTRALAIGLAVPATGALVAVVVALAAPMHAWSAPPPSFRDAPVVDSRIVLRADTELAVEVRPSGAPYVAPEASIARADGGGMGRIDGLGVAGVRVLETSFRGRHAWAVGSRDAVVYVDDDGERLDDELGDRISQRARAPLLFVLIATALAGIVAVRIRRVSAQAALLGASEGAGAEVLGAPRVVVGRLRVAPGARVAWLADDRVEVRGEARFEGTGGTDVVRLAEGEHRLEGSGGHAALDDGAPAFAVFPPSARRARSYRERADAAPRVLGVGSLDRAREAYLTHASRLLLVHALPAAALYVLSAIVLAFRCL